MWWRKQSGAELQPRAGERVKAALTKLIEIRDQITVYTYPGDMGGELAKSLDFPTVLLTAAGTDAVVADSGYTAAGHTDAADTIELAKKLLEEQVDLLLFAGGDGTARDIYEAVELKVPCVGIPAGVKIHSPVYAKNPQAAGRLALMWLTGKVQKTEELEVLDIDEERYRRDGVKHKALWLSSGAEGKDADTEPQSADPVSETASIEAIAYDIIEAMEPETCYLIGAGTTTRGIMHLLGLKNTLIGVDLICGKSLWRPICTGIRFCHILKEEEQN